MRVAEIEVGGAYIGKDGHTFIVLAKTPKYVAFTDNGKRNPAASPRAFAAYMTMRKREVTLSES